VKLRITNLFWPLGVSLLTGLISLYVATLGLFALGFSITPWHGLAFLIPAWIVAWLTSPGPARVRKSVWLLAGLMGLCGLLAGIASQFDDLSWDGMNRRIESVLGLSAGWNPVKDPTFQEGTRLAETNPYLRGSFVVQSGYQYSFGNLLAAYLAHLTGNLNAGKAVTPILAVASFGIAYGGLAALVLPGGWCVALALLAVLNPVAIYQSSSYYIDGHTGSLFTAMLFSALRLLRTGLNTDGLIALVVSFLGLSSSKTSGLFYGIIIDVIFLGFYAALHLKNLRPMLIFVGISALVTWPAGLLFRKVGGFPSLTLHYLSTATSPDTAGYGVGENSFGQDAMLKLDRAQIFVMSYFAPTEIVADRVKTKFPFWLNRRELAVFEDLTPDARAGGFGPLYGGCLLLAMASLGMILMGRAPPPASLFPIVPVLLSVGLTQTWWARWAPQGWLMPTALLIPVLCSLAAGPAGKRWALPFLCLFVGTLNSLLILLFYSAGCVRSQRVLNSQLAFLKTLPQPLAVHMPLFLSNRTWLIREEILFHLAGEPSPKPRLRLLRTNTTLSLPEGWEEKVIEAETVKEWRRRGLVEE
jgi:hypothetical protein